MTIAASADQDFVDDLRSVLTGLGSGDTHVQDVVAYRDETVSGLERWHLRLVLPRPRGRTWDPHETLTLSLEANERADVLAQQHGVLLDGMTAVDVVTDDAPTSELAESETPEPGEQVTDPESADDL